MRHLAPIVVYEEAPISYLVNGLAKNFYAGEEESFDTMANQEDPLSINYFVVRTCQDQDQIEDHINSHSPYIHQNLEEDPSKQFKFMCRLVGMIPCSDAFGVDIIVDEYEAAIQKNHKENITDK